MPKFNVEHSCAVNSNDAYQKLKTALSADGDFKKIDPNIEYKFNDSQLTCDIIGKQFKANLKISENGPGSQVIVTVDLPLLLAPFKGKVQETLQKKLAKVLG